MFTPWGMPYGTVNDLERYHDFMKKIDEETKEKEKKKKEYKPKTFTFGELFILLMFFSVPVGMAGSYAMVMGIKIWVEAMSKLIIR